MVLEAISINTTQLIERFTLGLNYILTNIVIPSLILVLVTIIILRIIRYILSKLAATRLIPSTLVEQIYRPLSMLAYLLLFFIILYTAFRLPEIMYIILIFIAVAILAGINTISDIIAYYVILWENKLRPGDTVELTQLNIKGRIEALTFTAVMLRKHDGTLVYIPNRTIISTPVRILSPIETKAIIEIELSIPRTSRNLQEKIAEIENRIRDILIKERIASRPQAINMVIRALEPNKVKIQLETPITGLEPRARQLNQLYYLLATELESYEPRISTINL